MARYIDANKINLKGISVFDENLDILVSLSDMMKAIAQTPTEEDVVKVVRCMYCNHCYHNPALGTFRCHRFMAVVDPYNFCSYGERKEQV